MGLFPLYIAVSVLLITPIVKLIVVLADADEIGIRRKDNG